MTRGEALGLYRVALRAIKKAFAGDEAMLKASAAQIREKYVGNRDLTSETEIQKLVERGHKAANYVATKIVQSKVDDRFRYSVKDGEQPAAEVPYEERLQKSA